MHGASNSTVTHLPLKFSSKTLVIIRSNDAQEPNAGVLAHSSPKKRESKRWRRLAECEVWTQMNDSFADRRQKSIPSVCRLATHFGLQVRAHFCVPPTLKQKSKKHDSTQMVEFIHRIRENSTLA
jgi:hypothetical protein